MNQSDESGVWVFNGERSAFPSAVFNSVEKAEEWIAKRGLSGVLTWYPIDVPVYDWIIAKGWWQPKKEHETEPAFIQQFSSASQEHYHYEFGSRES
jgi:hypothetical protein